MRTTIGKIKQIINEILHEKNEVLVYHASPQLNLKRIMPRFSPKFNEKGIFVSESLESIWNSWASWALLKPGATRTSRSSDMYENVAVYTFRIPRKLFDAAKKQHQDVAASSEGGLGVWGWDVETFIPEELLGDGGLVPSSVKVYTKHDLEKIDRSHNGWAIAGYKPKSNKPIVTAGGKNPARDAYRRLDNERDLAVMKYGGKPYEKKAIEDLFSELLLMTKKPRLNIDEQERLRELDELITTSLAGARAPPSTLRMPNFEDDPSRRRKMMYGDHPARPERRSIRQRSHFKDRK